MAQSKIKTYRDLQVWQKTYAPLSLCPSVPDKLQTQIGISMNLYYLKGDEFDKFLN